MKQTTRLFTILSAAAAIFLVGNASAEAQTFSGQATGVRATVTAVGQPVSTTAITDTGSLPSAGGSVTLTGLSASVPSILSVADSTVITAGSGNSSNSTASVDSLNIPSLLGNSLTADLVSASSQCSCPTSACTGSSTITNLRINGTPIAVGTTPNQSITLFSGAVEVGTVVINEQFSSTGSRTVNALHISVTDPLSLTKTDIVVASAHSDIHCVAAPSSNAYSGRAYGLRSTASSLGSSLSTIVADTGFLPSSGGWLSVSTASTNLAPLLSTGAVTGSTSGGLPGGNINTDQSAAHVDSLNVDASGVVTISASVVTSNTQCACSSTVASCTGNSLVTGLTVTALGLPVPVAITGMPNQVVDLPAGLGSIIINEQTSAIAGDITVNALHIDLNVAGLAATDIVVSSSHSAIYCAAIPTAAAVTVSGRATDAGGRPIARARVGLTGSSGAVRSVTTNSYGYFKFADVPLGDYILQASHKSYEFEPAVVNVRGDILEKTLTAK